MAIDGDSTDQLVVVGALMGAHGVRGDLRVKSFTAAPEDLFAYGPLLDGAGAVLIEPISARPAKTHFVVTPAAPRTREDWDAMKGTLLHVPRDVLPPAEEDEFYVQDLVGLTVYAGGEQPVGSVKAVQNYGAGDLIEVAPSEGGKSVLIPFTLDDVPTVDLGAGRIVVTSWELWTEEGGD